VADLFLAGVIPGLILTAVFALYVALRHRRSEAEVHVADEPQGRFRALLQLLPLVILISVVFGSIYGGYATPTESAVIGVLGGLLIAALNRTLTLRAVLDSLKETALFSGAIGFVLGASAGLQVAMAYTGIPREIVGWVEAAEMSQYQLLAILAVILLVMGCFIDGLSMIVLTGAVLQPVVKAAGIDLLWFGIYMVILVEIGLITPPIGFNLFVLQKLTDIDILRIGRATLPFIVLMLMVLLLITVFPMLVTFFPRSM
jgi:tripartite ATP-independent transporter DctM subunit